MKKLLAILTFFGCALLLQAQNVKPFIKAGQEFFETGKYNEAVEQFTKAIDLQPANADHYVKRARAYERLDEKLKAAEDYDNAIEYFSEYFDEAGPENEQQVMEELGQPKEAARELLLNLLQESVGDSKDITEEKTAALPAAGSYYGDSSHAHSRTDSGNLSTTGYSTSAGKKRSPGKIILLAFLVICASPVSIALLFAGLAVLAAVVIVIAAVIFSMAVTGVSAIAGGIVLILFATVLFLTVIPISANGDYIAAGC